MELRQREVSSFGNFNQDTYVLESSKNVTFSQFFGGGLDRFADRDFVSIEKNLKISKKRLESQSKIFVRKIKN